MQPFSRHARFFSSLKQVEERLASDQENRAKQPPTKDSIQTSRPPSPPSPDGLSSPLFLGWPQPVGQSTGPRPELLPDSSGPPPHEFLSSSPQGAETDASVQQPSTVDECEGGEGEGDDIEQLMALLGLSAREEGHAWGGSCHCSGGGFYSRVAGVKGPRCEQEAKRLDGWIDYYATEGKEPVRLAHLLLAKAACSGGGDDGEGNGFSGMEFPGTVDEFLEHDPPRLRS